MKRPSTLLGLALACVLTASTDAQQPPSRDPTHPLNVAILIFDGVQIIDYTGPYEVFGHVYVAGHPDAVNTYTVAERSAAVTTAMGMSVNPKFVLDNAPAPDILIVPGGDIESATGSDTVLSWVKQQSQSAQVVMSVCNGAFILAKAGLLDGLEATTTAPLIERLRDAAPKTRVRADVRYVDNGKVITTAGLSSGIDGSLHVIDRLYGRGTAQIAALSMEYNWDPSSSYVRAALADKYLPNRYNVEGVTSRWVPLRRAGDVDHWQSEWTATSDVPPAQLRQSVEEAFTHSDYFPRARHLAWKEVSQSESRGGSRSAWRFSDDEGRSWTGAVSVTPVAGQPKSYIVRVAVQRVGAVLTPQVQHTLG
jgi:putative intracellular protease/amidase